MSFSNIFLNRLSSGGSKSTVLKPLFFVLCFLLTGTCSIAKLELPNWVLYCFLIAMLLIFILFIVIYLICFFKNPDLIRSEKYLIEKLAIEKQFIGDNQNIPTNNPTIITVAKPNDDSKQLGGDNA